MIFNDDRDEEQQETHDTLVGGIDRFMSGWGPCKGGYSWAFWACTPEDTADCQDWVESRSDIKRVLTEDGNYEPDSRDCMHCHIYIYDGQGRD